MSKLKNFVACLSLILILNGILMPLKVLADGDPRKESPAQHFVAAAPGSPLGVIESFGLFKVNGYSGFGKGTIWRDDLLQAPIDMGARVSLGIFGKVTLEQGTIVRFTTVENRSGNTSHDDLVIQLIAGSISVTLQPEIKAYLDTFDSSFIAADGSKFRFGIRENRAVVDSSFGLVSRLGSWRVQPPPPIMLVAARATRIQTQAQAARQSYRIKPIGGINNSAVFDVRSRATRQIQVQVTDENDRPIPDIPIIFTLGSNIGKFSSTAVATNAQGIATVNLTAINQAASGTFTATVQGTNISLTGQIVVVKPPPSFWTVQNAAPVFATAAAAAAAAAAVAVTKDEPLTIRSVGGPVIKP